jgi:hypothetical protein
MARLHFGVTAGLALCAAGAYAGLFLHQQGLTALSVVLGWLLSVCAVAMAFVLVILLAFRSLSGSARPLFMRSWLGLVNGALAVSFWVHFGL